MNRDKSHIKIVILGNCDSGKTTLAGHFMYKCGFIDKRIFNQLEEKAKEMGKTSFKYIWIFNELKRTHEFGVNIDIPSYQFETNKNYITLIDGPGFRDYIKCLVTSVSLANYALFLVPASLGEFEFSISKCTPLRKHILFAYTMGIERMIVVINKMDTTDPPYSEDRFNEIKTEILLYLKKIGYQPQNIIFIPISAQHGDNLIEPSENMIWFKNSTINQTENTIIYKTLLEIFDNIVLPPKPIDKPLRLILQTMYKNEDAETMIVGYIETGILKLGMTVRFTPSNLLAQVKSIQMHYKTLEEALPGDKIVFTVNNINEKKLRPGFICSDANNDPAEEALYFIAQINVLSYSGHIIKGDQYVIHYHMAQVPCEFDELLEKIDQKTGKTIEKNPKFLKSDDIALVKIIPLKPICIEKYSDYSSLSRFVIFGYEYTIIVGTIKHVEKKIFYS